MAKYRKLKSEKLKKQRQIIIISLVCLTFLIGTGYAAFSTNITLNARGNIKYFDKTLATTYITNLKEKGDATLIDDETNDHNIRYSGKPVNNYLCLKKEKPCQEENLYRIIGVFNNIKTNEGGNGETRVKLIKATPLSNDMAWDENGTTNWAGPATLNTYLNSLSSASNELVDNAIWHLGKSWIGGTSTTHYINERSSNVQYSNYPTTWTGKIALMYTSDYGFASSACYKDKPLWASDSLNNDYRLTICKNSNWLFLDTLGEWTMTPASVGGRLNYVGSSGAVIDNAPAEATYLHLVRPSFYLKSNVKIIENKNDGSESKPYYLELENK